MTSKHAMKPLPDNINDNIIDKKLEDVIDYLISIQGKYPYADTYITKDKNGLRLKCLSEQNELKAIKILDLIKTADMVFVVYNKNIQYAISPNNVSISEIIGDDDNEVLCLRYEAEEGDYVFKFTELGLIYSSFDENSKELVLNDHEGDEVKISLIKYVPIDFEIELGIT